ncbi:hypothetical protein PGT21_014916 [Puccinia graminis f. sp. tritici]|uniref:Uncharacterized protein n=1 Tax=Puccinia graminis f. sp. tritici TaxID=56615 RepID=A0A5B0MRH2_PUCGR|nr:hypothetical protein PGT21_016310 [Puccinia graminis f. sp. tritici]KAA1082798.1 hypothetical protein PGT21_014916 [Puccinia graminis f. sp. tritici]
MFKPSSKSFIHSLLLLRILLIIFRTFPKFCVLLGNKSTYCKQQEHRDNLQ